MVELNKYLLASLKTFLDDFNYHLLMTMTLGESVYFVNPIPGYDVVKVAVKKLPQMQQKIISFFALGEPVEYSFIEENLGNELLCYMHELKLVNIDENDIWLNGYLLTSYANCYFLVSNVYYYPTNQSAFQKPYIGIDTYWLSRIITNKADGSVLDLCTGSGIQAILAAKTAQRVVAVDIDPISAFIAQLNACLNSVDDRMTVLNGDLYSVLEEDDKFDYIFSNPPFIPIPHDVDFPISGDGGEDGLKIIHKIISGYHKYLLPGGEAIMIGQGVGNGENISLANALPYLLSNFTTKIIVSGKTPIENQAYNFAELSNTLNVNNQANTDGKLWLSIYERLEIEYFYDFTFFAKNTNAMSNKHEVIHFFDSWGKIDTPVSKIGTIEKSSEQFIIHSLHGKRILTVDEEAVAFLQSIDGNMTLENLVEKLLQAYHSNYGNDSKRKLLGKYMFFCSMLERYGLMEKY